MPARRLFLRSKYTIVFVATVTAVSVVTAAEAAQRNATQQTQLAGGEPASGLTPAVLAEMRAQEALQPAVNALYEEYMRTPDSGFAGLAFEGDALTMYHKGGLSSGMQTALVTARKSGKVAVKPAAFSRAELEAQTQRIRDHLSATDAASDIQAVGRKTDGSGVIIQRMPAHGRAALAYRRSVAGKSAPVAADEVLRRVGLTVPTEVVVATHTLQVASSRIADTSPWNGGGRFEAWRDYNNDGYNDKYLGACTTGWGVMASGRSWILTAAHCANLGDNLYQGVFGSGGGATFTYMGKPHSDQIGYDVMLVNTPGWYLIFDGPPTTSNKKRVYSYGFHVENELLCQSGTHSGTVCGLRTARSWDVTLYVCDADDCRFRDILSVVDAWQVNGLTAALAGDSGGPVFTLDGTGVRAKGVTSIGQAGQTFMYYQDWSDIVRLFGAYPR